MIITQHEKKNDILILNFPICKDDTDIKSDKYCLPCHMGFKMIKWYLLKNVLQGTFFF